MHVSASVNYSMFAILVPGWDAILQVVNNINIMLQSCWREILTGRHNQWPNKIYNIQDWHGKGLNQQPQGRYSNLLLEQNHGTLIKEYGCASLPTSILQHICAQISKPIQKTTRQKQVLYLRPVRFYLNTSFCILQSIFILLQVQVCSTSITKQNST